MPLPELLPPPELLPLPELVEPLLDPVLPPELELLLDPELAAELPLPVPEPLPLLDPELVPPPDEFELLRSPPVAGGVLRYRPLCELLRLLATIRPPVCLMSFCTRLANSIASFQKTNGDEALLPSR